MFPANWWKPSRAHARSPCVESACKKSAHVIGTVFDCLIELMAAHKVLLELERGRTMRDRGKESDLEGARVNVGKQA